MHSKYTIKLNLNNVQDILISLVRILVLNKVLKNCPMALSKIEFLYPSNIPRVGTASCFYIMSFISRLFVDNHVIFNRKYGIRIMKAPGKQWCL